jgi:hypothetical protein
MKNACKLLKLGCLVFLFVFSSFSLPAQIGDKILIYIAPCTGDSQADFQFFDENFAREFTEAGYTLVPNETETNYRINLRTEANIDYGEYEDAKPKILGISLTDASNNREIISFGWEYDNPEEMAEWDLGIVYQSIPAASPEPPVPAAAPVSPDSGEWRNKRLYVPVYGGIDSTWFLSENINGADYTYTGELLSDGRRKYINTGNNQGGVIRPFGGAGAEIQFFDYLSAETGLKLRVNNVEGNENIPVLAFPLYLKFILKPGKSFMLEPYAGIELNISTKPEAVKPAVVSAAGGFQFGIWGGKPGAVFIDTNLSVDLGLSNVKGPYGEGKFQRIALGFSVGYKFGFFNRDKDTASAAPLPENAGPGAEYAAEYVDDEYTDYEDVPAEEEPAGYE